MAKVITFSTKFPSYHFKKGKPTFFVEQALNSLGIDFRSYKYGQLLTELNPELPAIVVKTYWLGLAAAEYEQKHHTIREGARFAAGELFSPRIWLCRPYHPNFYEGKKIPSQLILAPDTQVKRTWRFELTEDQYLLEGGKLDLKMLKEVARNDGFVDSDDLELWFQKPMKGQVICWSDKVKY